MALMNLTDDLLVKETARMLYYEHEASKAGVPQSELEEIQGRVETIKELLEVQGVDVDDDNIRQRAMVLFLAEVGLTPIEAAGDFTTEIKSEKKKTSVRVKKKADPSVEPTANVSDRLYSDFPFFCKMCLEIAYRPGLNPAAPDGGYGPFILNEGQRKVAAVMLDQWLNDIPVRIIILKSRQLGITTLLMAFWLWLIMQNPGITAMVIIDKGDHLSEKRQTYIRWLERISELYPQLPAVERRASKVIELQNMSRILFESAEAPNPGTSEHIAILHCSEKPKWPRGRDRQIDASIVPGIPEKGRTIYVDESTAEGVNGFYHRWHRVVEGKAEATPIFLPWYISAEYQTDPPESCFDSNGKFIFLNDDIEVCETDESGKIIMTEEEFYEKYELTPRQLYWRRSKIKNAFSGDRAIFDQEYPTTPRHAWQTVGGKFFSFEEVDKCGKSCDNPVLIGNLVDSNGNNDPLRLLPYGEYSPSVTPIPYGNLKIREMPKEGATYYVGGDVAEGKAAETAAGTTDYDYTVFVVKDEEGRTVALFRDRIKPEEAALPLLLLGMMYNIALINCERNGPGQVVWSMFKQTGYYNVYYRKGNTPILERAWAITTQSNRHPLLYSLRASYRELTTRPGFKETVEEMNEIIIDNKGKIQARRGAHDDIIMAEAHAWSLIYEKKGVVLHPDKPEKPEPPKNEFQSIMDFNGIERF